MSLARYFADVPSRFRDPERFIVKRTIHLEFLGPGYQDVRVYEVGSNGLVWAKDGSRG